MERISFALGLAAVATSTTLPAALGWPRAETWRVGVENDATTELSADTAPEGGFDVDGELWPVPDGGLATKDAPGTKTCHPFAIPRELLKAGENVFSFLNDTQSGTDSISIDSVWLEPVAPRNGMILRVR